MIFIVIGAILLVEIVLKVYVRKVLKDMDGVGGMHDGGRERDTIHMCHVK